MLSCLFMFLHIMACSCAKGDLCERHVSSGTNTNADITGDHGVNDSYALKET